VSQPIFIDTAFLLALADVHDEHHATAVKWQRFLDQMRPVIFAFSVSLAFIFSPEFQTSLPLE